MFRQGKSVPRIAYFRHNVGSAPKALPVTITQGDVEGNPPLEITDNTHEYDLGAKGLPLTIADGDLEEKPVLRIQGNTHLSATEGQFSQVHISRR